MGLTSFVGLKRDKQTADQIFRILQIVQYIKEYNMAVYQLLADLKTSHHCSIRREVLFTAFVEFGVSVELVRLIKMLVNENY